MNAARLLVCYGGTFDPVHEGHLAVARSARDALDADVALVPARDPPHKGPTRADAAQRARMLELAVAGEAGLSVDLRELHREGPSYTFASLGELRAELGDAAPIAWLVGADSLLQLHTWHRWRDLVRQTHIAVAPRSGSSLAQAPAALQPWVAEALKNGSLHILQTAAQDLSSTAIRQQLAASGYSTAIPATVQAYIRQHHLYAATHE